MKPRRTRYSNRVYRLEGGTEDNDLWVEENFEEHTIRSVWQLTDEERQKVADGQNVYLVCWGVQIPVAIQRRGQSQSGTTRT
jgi:hypothetical protein